MNKKVTIYSAVLAIMFALAGCLGDSNQTIYTVCSGLCIISLLVFIASMLRQEFAPKCSKAVRAAANEKGSLKRTA